MKRLDVLSFKFYDDVVGIGSSLTTARTTKHLIEHYKKASMKKIALKTL